MGPWKLQGEKWESRQEETRQATRKPAHWAASVSMATHKLQSPELWSPAHMLAVASADNLWNQT